MNKNSDFVQAFVPLGVGWGGQCPNSFFKLLELFETSQVRKLIFGLQINIDKHKANSHRYDVTR